jgi:hypothetical protein
MVFTALKRLTYPPLIVNPQARGPRLRASGRSLSTIKGALLLQPLIFPHFCPMLPLYDIQDVDMMSLHVIMISWSAPKYSYQKNKWNN